MFSAFYSLNLYGASIGGRQTPEFGLAPKSAKTEYFTRPASQRDQGVAGYEGVEAFSVVACLM